MAAAALLVGFAAAGLSSCALLPASGSCVDYISLKTPAERFAAAPVVVVADISTTDRTIERAGRYDIHRAKVSAVLKGSVSAKALDVINPSDQCTTSRKPVEYLEGDDLNATGSRVLYLAERRDGSDVWTLFVPNGVDPADVAASLPRSK
ncbi:hypothetical protein GCM10025867_16360 [Frondihabitans sucicola]|uniref:Lipoprotein n=1 Tax=Frondihabitans sucicola TaxID=1268041 RepID=A0ABM8GLV6_9MICO|nr:hypothetical protein [Frondihabitans sucicola]BDZ49395.1 hypothetical protein GCM10025867_16360 [Frondihabitans sucicola]